jgi:hypothetical protein
MGYEELEGTLVIAKFAAEIEETVAGEGVAGSEAADLCAVDGKVSLILLVKDVELER